MPTAHRLCTPRLSLTPYHPRDAAALADVVRGTRDHLRRWMPFATREPEEHAYAELFASFQERFARGDYTFVIRTHDGVVVGGCGLHPSVGELGREIGYWLVEDQCGNGFATEAVAALCHLAFVQEEVDRVELRIQPANHASIRVAERCGCICEGSLRRRLAFPGEPPRDVLVYTLFRDAWPDSSIHAVPVERFGTSGSRQR